MTVKLAALILFSASFCAGWYLGTIRMQNKLCKIRFMFKKKSGKEVWLKFKRISYWHRRIELEKVNGEEIKL